MEILESKTIVSKFLKNTEWAQLRLKTEKEGVRAF